MKKILAGLGMAAMAFAVTGMASASSIGKVGDASFALSKMQRKITANLITTNSFNALNVVKGESTTGGNYVTSADDQSGTKITTGSSSAASLTDSTANTVSVDEDVEVGGPDDTISEVTDDSKAIVKTEDTLDNQLNTGNTTEVKNIGKAEASTGDNHVTSDDSLADTSVTTGGTETAAGLTQMFNVLMKNVQSKIVFKLH